MRIVFDTNVIVSATGWANSVGQKLILKLVDHGVKIYISSEILSEFQKVLVRDFNYSPRQNILE